MALRCNNCGAPLIVPQGETQTYAVCQYCQTATALPQRRRSKPQREQRPTNQVVVTTRSSASPVKLFVALAALSLLGAGAAAAFTIFQENRPLPSALSVAPPDTPALGQARAVERPNLESNAQSTQTRDPTAATREPAKEPTATARKSLRAADAAPTAKPSATSAPTASPVAPPPPPPLPKNVKAVIGNIKIEAGKYPLDTLKSRMASNTGAARACYEKILLEKPDTEGTLNMNFQIAPAGTTRGVGVTGSFLPSELSGCMNRAFLALKFPPTEGESVNVRFTVKLSHD